MAGFMRLQVWREEIAHPSASESDASSLPVSEVDGAGEEYTPGGEKFWWACYSAPGYMDRTDTLGPFDTAAEAITEACDLYGSTPEDLREALAMLSEGGVMADANVWVRSWVRETAKALAVDSGE